MKNQSFTGKADAFINSYKHIGKWPLGILIYSSLVICSFLFVLGYQYFFTPAVKPIIVMLEILSPLIIILLPSTVVSIYLLGKLAYTSDYINNSTRQEKQLNKSLQDNISRLNHEIEERKRAFQAKRRAVDELSMEVSERKKAEQELQSQSLLMRSIIDSSPDLFYYRDEKGAFASCNHMFEVVIDKKSKDILGKYPSEIFGDETAVADIINDQEVSTHHVSLTMDVEYKTPSGMRWFEMRKMPFYDDKGKYIGLLGFGRDITERKLTETKLETSYIEKGRFIATLSHELRTPLNGVVGLARMLLESDMTQEQRSWVNTIFSSAETLGNIFNDIIDLDKLDRSELDIASEVVSLTDFINDVFNFGSLVAQQKSIDFDLQREGDFEQFVSIDPTRLRQVLWNLINNAIKFTKRGGVSVYCEMSGTGESTLTIKVIDSGIGIPEDELTKIFGLYYKVSSEQQNNALGSGIGLAVSKTLVEKMGGSLTVASQLGKGSEFTVTIPIHKTTQEKPEKYDGKALHVLLIEDIPLNAQIAISLLEQRGHEVIWAETGEDALAFLETEDDFDLILLDMQLPDMNGCEIATYIRNDNTYDKVSIVALTANVRKADEELQGVSIQGSLAKPLNTKKLDRTLSGLFGTETNNDTALRHKSAPALIVSNRESKILDLESINEFMEVMGRDTFIKSLDLFDKLFPQYIDELREAIKGQLSEEFSSVAHKLKGAAGSVGLKSVQISAKAYEAIEQHQWDKLTEEMDTFFDDVKTDLALAYEYCKRQ